LITLNDTPQSVGLPWTSDQSVAETSTGKHTTLTTDKYPCPRWDFFFKEALLIQLIHGRLYLFLLFIFLSQIPSSLHQFIVPAGALYGFGFEPTIAAGERLKTYALDRAATGTGVEVR
jgi:hypothetical protein